MRLRTKFTSYAFSFAIGIPSTAAAVSIYNPTVSVLPIGSITTNSRIELILSGSFATPGFTLAAAPNHSINGYDLNVVLSVLSPVLIPPSVITPFSYSTLIGYLQPATYRTTATFEVDGIVEHTLIGQMLVSPVPEPAAIGLLSLGFLVTVYAIAMQKRKLAA